MRPKQFVLIGILVVDLLCLGGVAALYLDGNQPAATNPPGQFAYFYKPPEDGTRAAAIAARTSFVILTRGDENYRATLKAAGYAGPVYQYLAAAEVDGPGPYRDASAACDRTFTPFPSNAAMDAGDFCKFIHPNEAYFLHNAKGERLFERDGYRTIYHLNPAARGWQDFFIQRAKRELQGDAAQPARGFDGLFLDNVWVELDYQQHRLANSTDAVREFATDRAYQAAMAGFLSRLRGALGSSSIFANLTSDAETANSWDTYLPYLDGGMDEAFAADWDRGYLSAAGWNVDLRRAENVQAQGKIFIAVTQGHQDDTDRARFGFASYLLVIQPGKSFFRYAYARNGYEYAWDYRDFSIGIGTPTGPRYQQADGTWRRDFTEGYVEVNPATHSARLAPARGWLRWLPQLW